MQGANYHQLYNEQITQITLLATKNIQLEIDNKEQRLEIDSLKLQMAQLRKMIYGAKQEKFIPNTQSDQLTLSLDLLTTEVIVDIKKENINYERVKVKTEKTASNHPGRTKLPAHLPRIDTVIEPSEITSEMIKIGEEITEELELEPGRLFVNRIIRPKYVNRAKEEIIIAPMIERPLPKVIAGAGLLSQLLIDKYVDHLPIYRIQSRFKRENVDIPYNTMVDWVGQTITLITPLYNALRKKILATDSLQGDETGIKVLDKDKKGTTHKGWMWAFQNSIERMVLFEYQSTRGRVVPMEILKDYKGHLQTDGYSVYSIFKENQDIILLHCMAHARRMFFEAQSNDAERSSHALTVFQSLYAIEREIKEKTFSFEEIQTFRENRSMPILNEFKSWLTNQITLVLPSSGISKAIVYSLSRWNELTIYTTNGKLNIDNNPVENSIRPIALGRKNYLFAGSHEAAQRTAIVYSLLGTCKLNGINPLTWLKETLIRLPNHPVNKLNELLPLSL